ncbi:protein TOPAZ1 isoform X2 [Kryptolebias marmoratus]|uniref:protein TOPAZ1 isoform X2 n=1 Tax=Kryptolebias marmoratus TaxID=37003 RepID=UPI0018AC9484|nr:protein TOPAZ1 isoform X2 [Kryptolebias marmoratus]
MLCDVAIKCDLCSHNCSYVLPDLFKTKVVRCFRQDMKAGLQISPSCSGHNKLKGVKSALVKNRKRSSDILNKKSISHPESLTGHKNHLEDADSQASRRPAKRFHNGWTEEDSETCSAAFLGDNQTDMTECRTSTLVEEDTVHRDKRRKLGDSSTSSPALEENCFAKKSCDQRGELTAGPRTASDVLSENDEADTDDPESFTCQRVKAYFSKVGYSCARTYVSWPFLNRQPASSAGSVDPSATDNSVTGNQNQACLSTKQGENTLQDPSLEKQSSLAEKGKSFSLYRANMDVSVRSERSEDSPPSPQSHSVLFPIPSLGEREPGLDAAPTSPFPVNGTKTDTSTPSPSALCLSDWENASAASPWSDPSTRGASSSISGTPRSLPPSLVLLEKVKELQTVEKLLLCDDASLSPVHSSDSCHSCVSPSLLHQHKHKNDTFHTERSPPKLKPYNTSPFKHECSMLCDITKGHCAEMASVELRLPPVLSPVTSPQCCLWRRSLSCQSSSSSDEEEVLDSDANRTKTFPECHVVQIVNGSNENSEDFLKHIPEEMEVVSSDFRALTDCMAEKPQSSSDYDKDVSDQNEDDSLDYSDHEPEVEEGSRSQAQVSPEPKLKPTHGSGVLTETCSSPGSDEEDNGSFREEEEQYSAAEEGLCFPKTTRGDIRETEADGDCQQDVLDEFTAYEQDILLVDVTQDDPELFQNLPRQSLLKLGPARRAAGPGKNSAKKITFSTRIDEASPDLEQRIIPVPRPFPGDSPDITEESDSRPWRPRCSTTSTKIQNACPAADKQTRHLGQSDANNNQIDGGLERGHPIQTVNSHVSPLMPTPTGLWLKNAANGTDFRRQKCNAYCRQYFSESLTCGFKMCRFQHLPLEGDEKFCVETVARFIKVPMCLQKAGAVFTGYYQSNPPGVYFSMPVLLSLLWALLKAGMVLDVFSVLGVSLAHNLVPDHEFLLALFNLVREKSLMGFVPKLMELTFKMASVGLELSLDCLDCVKNTPMFQQTVQTNSPVSVSGNHKFFTNTPLPEYLNLAHAVVEIELCTKQEDWKRMGGVFKALCQFSQHPNQVERISGRVAIGLLAESKDKVSLPFAVFAETVCQNEDENSPIKTFVGRIGVSLMLRYHKTHQWTKGRRVVEVMSASKVGYATLKGLFGNEDGASQCCLVTVATELFLLSGSVEGALNALRENNWFLSSSLWPCEPDDLESRTRLLICLAEKTSHRDTLEVLRHLPGLKEPNDSIDISRYSPVFNSHLQVCVEKQILPVASDTVNFMLCKNLPVDHSVLQVLMHKLGKQNLWLRAREVFKRSQSLGYYSEVSAPPGLMSLTVPCRLGEMELVLAFEMVITVNASIILPLPEPTTTSLSITLKRTQSCESDYISAGSRILSAARIPQPKLVVHYTAVNSSQEQVFRLDVSSARRWLRRNLLWASEIWTH